MGKKKKLLLVLVSAVMIAALGLVLVSCKSDAGAGSKEIEINVVNDAGETQSYTVKTDAEFLKQAMEETEGLTFSGTEGDYGLMVTEVNGVTADYDADQAYWAFYVNDEYCSAGIDEQPVADGDVFRIEYTK